MTKQSPATDARTQQAYHDLVQYVKWVSRHYEIPGHYSLNRDDLEAESFFMIAKICPRYMDRSYDDFLRIAKASISNAIGSLRYKATLTHRREGTYNLSTEHDMKESNNPLDQWIYSTTGEFYANTHGDYTVNRMSDHFNEYGLSPEKYVEISERFADLFEHLSEFDREVMDALLGGNERVGIYLDLTRKRRNYLYAEPTIRVTPLIIARALCAPVEDVEAAYQHIKDRIKQTVFQRS